MSKETIKQKITSSQEKANKIFEKVKQVGNTEVNSENIQKAVQAIRKVASEKAKFAIVGGAAALTFGTIDKLLSTKENQGVYLPAVVEALDNANAQEQGKKAAMDYLNQGIPVVSKKEYYNQVALKEPANSIVLPNTTEKIALELEAKSNESKSSSSTSDVLIERSKQKVTQEQSLSITKSANEIEDNNDNRKKFVRYVFSLV